MPAILQIAGYNLLLIGVIRSFPRAKVPKQKFDKETIYLQLVMKNSRYKLGKASKFNFRKTIGVKARNFYLQTKGGVGTFLGGSMFLVLRNGWKIKIEQQEAIQKLVGYLT